MNYRPLIILLGLGLLVGLFVLLRPAHDLPDFKPEPPADTTAKQSSPSPPGASITSKKFFLIVRNRRLVSGMTTLPVKEGDDVTIDITSDQAEELHLHGYDRKLDLVAGKPGVMAFKADRSGRFEYELEHARVVLGVLEVQPR